VLASTRLTRGLAVVALGTTPEGWPETGGAWINAATLYSRIKLATNMADSFGTATPEKYWPNWASLSAMPLARQVDAVANAILGGVLDSATRSAMLAVRVEAPTAPNAGEFRLRGVLAIAFASPEFQRR